MKCAADSILKWYFCCVWSFSRFIRSLYSSNVALIDTGRLPLMAIAASHYVRAKEKGEREYVANHNDDNDNDDGICLFSSCLFARVVLFIITSSSFFLLLDANVREREHPASGRDWASIHLFLYWTICTRNGVILTIYQFQLCVTRHKTEAEKKEKIRAPFVTTEQFAPMFFTDKRKLAISPDVDYSAWWCVAVVNGVERCQQFSMRIIWFN